MTAAAMKAMVYDMMLPHLRRLALLVQDAAPAGADVVKVACELLEASQQVDITQHAQTGSLNGPAPRESNLALGLWCLERQALRGNPGSVALLAYVQELEAERAATLAFATALDDAFPAPAGTCYVVAGRAACGGTEWFCIPHQQYFASPLNRPRPRVCPGAPAILNNCETDSH